MLFLTEKKLKALRKANSVSCNGYFIYADIKNSTSRKEAYKSKWTIQTETVYSVFNELVKAINKENSLKLVVKKHIGDGMMAFFKSSESVAEEQNSTGNSDVAQFIFDNYLNFREQIHDSPELCGMRLKSILTYLTNIYPVQKGSDVLGRGIDFSFRLERFADASHLLVNEMMKINICGSQKDEYKQFDFIQTRRTMRGWNNREGELFYIVTNKDMIVNALDLRPSISDLDVKTELFKFYLEKNGENKSNISFLEAISKLL